VFVPQLADLDGDGRPDLLSGSTCCQDPFCFYVFRGQPGGKFGPLERVKLEYPAAEFDRYEDFPLTGLQSRIAVADWNGDGKPDVLVGGSGGGAVGVLWGPVTGRERYPVRRLWAKERELLHLVTNPCLADWDGDGLLDLVAGATEGAGAGVYWCRNNGTRKEPKLEPPRLLVPERAGSYLVGIAVADWNADGHLDLIVSRQEYRETATAATLEHHRIWVHLRRAGPAAKTAQPG
jgi:hypothetical protein